MRIRVKLDVR
ncbi:hypothetical protein LINPERHAP1_LOCUS36358 [Linum perenne]